MEPLRNFIYMCSTFGLPIIREIVNYVRFRQNQNRNDVQLTITTALCRNCTLRRQNLPTVVLGNLETRSTRQIRNKKSKLRKKRRRNIMLNSPSQGRVRVMRALYKYTAQYPDELSFQEGDLLYVFDEVADPNWWKARCGNQTGLIPSNYVGEHTEEVEQPLHEAARRGNLSFMRECLQQGVSGTGLDSAGNTPLYWASHAGHVDCVRELLALPRPAVNAQNVIGDTPLHTAAARGHYEVVELLLQHGADSQISNKDQKTPSDLSMNSAITNMLQLSRASHQRTSLATYNADEYADDLVLILHRN